MACLAPTPSGTPALLTVMRPKASVRETIALLGGAGVAKLKPLSARLMSGVGPRRIPPEEGERTRSRGGLNHRSVEQIQQGASFVERQSPEMLQQGRFAWRELVQDAELEITEGVRHWIVVPRWSAAMGLGQSQALPCPTTWTMLARATPTRKPSTAAASTGPTAGDGTCSRVAVAMGSPASVS